MEQGGDPIGNKPGFLLDDVATPWDILTDPGKKNMPADPVYKTCAATTLGEHLFQTNSVVSDKNGAGTLSEGYRILRNFVGYTGNRIFEAPGFVTFGYSSGDGNLTTPALSNITGTTDVLVTFKVGRRTGTNADTKVTVSVSGGGTISSGGTPSTFVIGGADFPVTGAGVWETKTFTISGATSTTKIKFENTIQAVGSRNFSLDDILVSSL
jgi:hypothetical protein